MSDDNLIKIRDLSFSRGSRIIFNNISLDIPKGKVVAIMGPSGTGKTTLLKLIGGQLTPSSGYVEFEGENVHQLGRKDLYRIRKKMGMLFQSGALFTDMNVYDNVAFPIRENTSLPEAIIRPLVLMKLQAVGLRGARNLMPSELSGGMARRVAMARAVSLDPDLMMYDEPFTGQDPISMGVLVQLIRLLNDALNLTSVVVSHDVPEVMSIADYAYIISGGKVLAHGDIEQIRESNDQRVKQFMEGLPDGPVPFHYPADDYKDDLLAKG
ncbi:MAG: phospholipid ABC transporter ATP-binding protein MlaF [Kangiellaceae bacterium]|jgi:phospholipid/cholesterol/gamma-HCH transport system ATP-binding protein|nr:phospholipid ABC transporter ATP-binding protein MlaF [Kangiellaceae bacterium]|tara:strand:- start:14491 stop:15294 length:804 start_codon:yes stop_codon:yes gene_type:complete